MAKDEQISDHEFIMGRYNSAYNKYISSRNDEIYVTFLCFYVCTILITIQFKEKDYRSFVAFKSQSSIQFPVSFFSTYS